MTELKKQYEVELQNSKKSWGGNITIEHQITADGYAMQKLKSILMTIRM